MAPGKKPQTATYPAIEDERGREWQDEMDRRWTAELEANPDAPVIEPPALPDFAELRPAYVTRDVFGGFVVDEDGPIVHRIETATEACRVDAIRAAMFYHFGHEVPETVPRCPECLG